ncbi:MAG: FIVAR domain-containing protein, partial [Bifidobacteriaceae bacterium]|jgi:hypothetical protein|nr:FIVAR domain-containing protein [Bifidobacteriaceae bacterium]
VDVARGLSNADGQYTQESWSTLQGAIEDAQDVLIDPDALVAAIAAATAAVADGLAGLVSPPNHTVLASVVAIAKAQSNANGRFTEDSWTAMGAAVAAAEELLGSGAASQELIDAAVDAVVDALASLAEAPDKSVLASVLATADAKSNEDGSFTPDSWEALMGAVAAAQTVAAAPESTQAEIDAAVDAVAAGLAGLVGAVPQPDEPTTPDRPDTPDVPDMPGAPAATVARGGLTSVLATADGLVQDAYTPESAGVVQAAVVKARAVLADPAASQDEVDSAVSELVNALTALRPRVAGNSDTPPAPVVTVARVKAGQSRITLVRRKSVTVPVAVYFADNVASYSGALAWKSSNPKIAKVSQNGKITAIRAGKATVTATSKAVSATGKKLSVKIAVTVAAKRSAAKVAKVDVKAPKTLTVGQVAYATGSYVPVKASGVKVTYKSSRPEILAVDKAGRLMAKAKGKAVLTVKAGPSVKKVTVAVK